MQKLQALGYVASDTAEARDDKKLTGVDPKAKIEVSNLLHDAMFDVEDARYQEASRCWNVCLKEQPKCPSQRCSYGMAQAR